MSYLLEEKERFANAKTPVWKRVPLPENLFPSATSFQTVTYNQPTGVRIQDLKTVIDNPELKDYLKIDRVQDRLLDEAFSAYINHQFNHGLLIEATKDSQQILKIEYRFDKDNPILIDQHLIVVEAGVNLDIVIDYSSKDNSEQQHYGFVKLIAKQGSRVNLSKIQRLNDSSHHFDMVVTEVEEGASVIYNDAEIGAAFKASSAVQRLTGLRADGQIYSAYHGAEKSASDLAYTIEHAAKKTTSAILSKGALAEDAKKVFRGNLYFERGSAQSVGREEEFVVLLSDNLKSDSMPGLFAQEDDVIGEHAASVGQVDANKMFYIMSRGFSEIEAKKLIVRSAYEEVLEKMELKEDKHIIQEALEKRIK